MTVNQIIPEKIEISPDQLSVFTNKEYPIRVFDEVVIRFFNTLSKQILKNKQINHKPGLVALGFWLRKANIEAILNENSHLLHSSRYKLSPMGVVFHICPANVDTMFLYSLAISLLTGNKNILRLSSKTIDNDIIILFNIITEMLQTDEFSVLKDYLSMVQYEHNDEVSSFLSANADARIIWGGDNTVKLFKAFPTKSRTKDIFFPDRVSCSLFKANAFIGLDNNGKLETVRNFYNDSYIFDQKGCSSPQILFIYGNTTECKAFETEFYEMLKDYSASNYQNDIFSLASLKLNHLVDDIFNDNLDVNNIVRKDNHLYFVEINTLSEQISSCGGGYFYIHKINQLAELLPFIKSEVQTLTYFGLTANECLEIENLSFGRGIDRIVPVGEALNFEYIWDGYNLLDELCLKKRVKLIP